MELLVAKLGLLLEAQTDKIAGMLFLIVASSTDLCFCWGGYCSSNSSMGGMALFFDHWCRDCHSRAVLSDDDEGGHREKGSLSAHVYGAASLIVQALFEIII